MVTEKTGLPSWSYFADMDDLRDLTGEQKVEWLCARLHRLIIRPAEFIRHELKSTDTANPRRDFNLGLMTVFCCALEALGNYAVAPGATRGWRSWSILKYLRQETTSRRNFRDFVGTYMPEFGEISSKLYDDYRCGLAHGLVIRRGIITEGLDSSFKRGGSGTPTMIDFDLFMAAFKKAIEDYFARVRGDSEIKARLIARWDKEFRFWATNSRERKTSSRTRSK